MMQYTGRVTVSPLKQRQPFWKEVKRLFRRFFHPRTFRPTTLFLVHRNDELCLNIRSIFEAIPKINSSNPEEYAYITNMLMSTAHGYSDSKGYHEAPMGVSLVGVRDLNNLDDLVARIRKLTKGYSIQMIVTTDSVQCSFHEQTKLINLSDRLGTVLFLRTLN